MIDDQHARQQLDLVTEKVKCDRAGQIHEIVEDDFAEWTLLQRGVEGDSRQQVCDCEPILRKKILRFEILRAG